MTTGGVSKKVFFGCILGQQLVNMAIAETNSEYRFWYFWGLYSLIIVFWAKQAILDYINDIRN